MCRGKSIPVPAVERVPSPWTEAEQLPSQSQSEPLQQPKKQKQADPAGEVAQARPQAAQQAQLRRRQVAGMSSVYLDCAQQEQTGCQGQQGCV